MMSRSEERTEDRTATAGAGAALGLTRVLRLVVVYGEATGRVVPLATEATRVIGREGHVEGTLAFRDSQISREHARISVSHDGVRLVDLQSRNGTFVNGARVLETALASGDIIRAGGHVLLFEDLTIPAAIGLEPENAQLPGPSLAMSRVRAEVALVAPEQIPVLILGETGCGKELVAEAVHRGSERAGAFVPVNCAAIAPGVAESELFGHAAGAFTGATSNHAGLFTAADRGTLFLDEVGELPPQLQAKLLRALAKGEVRQLGTVRATTVDARVVAATHRELGGDDFRADLLARLSGWTIRVPPLRERRQDILALAKRFGGELAADAAEALAIYGFPHNVRELKQIIAAARVRSGGKRIELAHLPQQLVALLRDRELSAPVTAAPLAVIVPRDRVPAPEELALVIERHEGSIARTAEYFGKDRKQIYRWLERS